MSIHKSTTALDLLKDELVDKRIQFLATKNPRERKTPFHDPDYRRLSKHDVEIIVAFTRKVVEENTQTVLSSLIHNEQQRVSEAQKFLKRHNIHIDVDKNSYQELDLFLLDNLDAHENFELEDNFINLYWSSIMIDLGLYITHYKKQQYSQLNLEWSEVNSITNEIHLTAENNSAIMLTSPIWIMLRHAENINDRLSTYYSFPSLQQFISMHVEEKILGEHEANKVLNSHRERRIRKESFIDSEYKVNKEAGLLRQSVKDTTLKLAASKTLYKARLIRIQEIQALLERHIGSSALSKDNIVAIDEFIYDKLTPHPNVELEYSQTDDFWTSVIVDLALYVMEEMAKMDDNLVTFIDKTKYNLGINIKNASSINYRKRNPKVKIVENFLLEYGDGNIMVNTERTTLKKLILDMTEVGLQYDNLQFGSQGIMKGSERNGR